MDSWRKCGCGIALLLSIMFFGIYVHVLLCSGTGKKVKFTAFVDKGADARDACIVYRYRPKHCGLYWITLRLAQPNAELLAASPYRVEVGEPEVRSKLAAFGPPFEPPFEPLQFGTQEREFEPQLELGVEALFSIEFNGEKPPREQPYVEMTGNRLQLADGGDGSVAMSAYREGPDFVHYKFTPPETGAAAAAATSSAAL